jgi:hypothetical protein
MAENEIYRNIIKLFTNRDRAPVTSLQTPPIYNIRYNLENFEKVQNFYDTDDIIIERIDRTIMLNKAHADPIIWMMKNNIIVATDYFNYFLSRIIPSRSISFEYLLSMYNDTTYSIYDNSFFYKEAIHFMWTNNLWLRTNLFNRVTKIEYTSDSKKRKAEVLTRDVAYALIDGLLGAPYVIPCIDPTFINAQYKYYDLEKKPIPENSRKGFIGKYEPDLFCCTNHQIAGLKPQLKFDCDVRPEEGSDNYKKLMIDRLDYVPAGLPPIEINATIRLSLEQFQTIFAIFQKIKCSLTEHNNPVFCTYKKIYTGPPKSANLTDLTDFYDVLIIGYIFDIIVRTEGRSFPILLWKVRSPINPSYIGGTYILSDFTYSCLGLNRKNEKLKSSQSNTIKVLSEKYNIKIIDDVEAFDLTEISCKEKSCNQEIVKTGCKFIPYLKFE